MRSRPAPSSLEGHLKILTHRFLKTQKPALHAKLFACLRQNDFYFFSNSPSCCNIDLQPISTISRRKSSMHYFYSIQILRESGGRSAWLPWISTQLSLDNLTLGGLPRFPFVGGLSIKSFLPSCFVLTCVESAGQLRQAFLHPSTKHLNWPGTDPFLCLLRFQTILFFFIDQKMIQENAHQPFKRVQNDLRDRRLQTLTDDSVVFKISQNHDVIVHITPRVGAFTAIEYVFKIVFPSEYPFKPPKVVALTWVTHPNIDLKQKLLFLSLLNENNWKPTFGLFDIFLEMKRTIVHIDFTYIPNTRECIRSAQRMGRLDHSTDEEQVDEEMEDNTNFRHNFELDRVVNRQMERESSENTDEENVERSDQLPEVVDMRRKKRHFLEDDNAKQ